MAVRPLPLASFFVSTSILSVELYSVAIARLFRVALVNRSLVRTAKANEVVLTFLLSLKATTHHGAL
ncbi:hypothetical protein JS84_03835 [Vibrio vulnificus]|uniref:hypothetical protein n=2 Tax=Vibrio vulnificus TaxID=672 RepID=UPI00034C862A|nr:hypothetical protein [Vibrio vulnificus]EWS69318.1 hypothetical protein Y702_09390 [Vibrio vulnificus BAA87]KFK58893.1 hypothetical protein JS83_16080 [Vibrio vulnificus]KFK65852.1 hypothetical protein JS84_03835 [Vibrio vulnificus]KFK69522.1 hypothetical protein JS85_08800 [Vibrio vulnificus]KLI65617.1 hypothetical protein VVYB158_21885 [Vibrio vulnificus CladeA-yb158]